MRWRVVLVILSCTRFLSAGSSFPLDPHPSVLALIRAFASEDSDFAKRLEQGEPYRAMVEGVFTSYGLPRELFYLGLIESGYEPQARSAHGALGIWQFTRRTGSLYGLRALGARDERRDPCRSTRAAAKYLRDLYLEFGSWQLTLAAYNAGEFRVKRAILRGGTTHFWTLARKRLLPRETIGFVPKFLAAVEVGENPGAYGLARGIADTEPFRCRSEML